MRPLSRLEQLLERLLERPAGRLFRTSLQPIQVQRRIERAMEADRRSDGARTRVPDRYLVRLEPRDLAALIATSPDVAADLADAALAFARAHGYTLAGGAGGLVRGRPRAGSRRGPGRRRADRPGR